MTIHSYPNPGYLYQLTRRGNGIESVIHKNAYNVEEKEQTLYIYLTPSRSSTNPFNNFRLRAIMDEAEVVVFDTPPFDEKLSDDFGKFLQNYNQEVLLRINNVLTQSLNSRNINIASVDQKIDDDHQQLAKEIKVKAVILMAENLGLSQLCSDSIPSKISPQQRIHQKAEEKKKRIEYIDSRNFIEKNKKLFNSNFLELLFCSVITDKELFQEIMHHLKIEDDNWSTGTIKSSNASTLEKSPVFVELQKMLENETESKLILVEKIHNYFSSKKKTLLVLEQDPKSISGLKSLISLCSNVYSEIEIKGPIKEPTGCFWKIKKENITVGYLLGSIHKTPNYLLNLNNRIRHCFEKSSRLAVEIDTTRKDIAQAKSLLTKKQWAKKYSSFTHDQIDTMITTLKKLFPKESERVDFNNHQAKGDFIFNAIAKLKSRVYFESELFSGIDLQLIQQAKYHNKPIEDLETLEQYKQQKSAQVTLKNDLIKDLFLQTLLSEELKQMNAAEIIKLFIEQFSIFYNNTLKSLFDAWEEGNLEKLDLSKRESMDKTMVMVERNLNMACKIVHLVNDKEKIFCCMGVAHTAGQMNVQAFLEKFGFSTERVFV